MVVGWYISDSLPSADALQTAEGVASCRRVTSYGDAFWTKCGNAAAWARRLRTSHSYVWREWLADPNDDPCLLTDQSVIDKLSGMARPLSDEKRNALMRAATRVIVTQGLGAQTAVIAREAGVASGSLFTYFETKRVLFNELYLELKAEMGSAAMANLPRDAALHAQLLSAWSNWMHWVIRDPDKRHALARLSVSEEITPETRELGHKSMAGLAELLEQCRAAGPMQEASMSFVVSVMSSLAETTMDFMLQDPPNAEKHCQLGFGALWRTLH